jgi:peptidyl-prolyl cis-trans isomerase SurA
MLFKEYRDGILLFSLMNEEVWQKGIQDSIGQRQYFKENRENYQWKERAEALIVKVLDLNRVNEARTFLNGKTYTEELVNNFQTQIADQYPLAYQIESGLMEIPDQAVLSRMDKNLSYQEIEIDGHLHLVLTGEIFPAGSKEFEETRGIVIRDYQEYLDEQLIKKLRLKYPVEINETIKEEAFVALNQ